MENLIATYQLPTYLGAGFGVGTVISVYRDDFLNTIVVKKTLPTAVFGSNVATEGDAGYFESLATSWGTIGAYLTRSSTQAYDGTYSALYTQPDAINRVLAKQSGVLTGGKTYRVSCFVFIPTGSTIVNGRTVLKLENAGPLLQKTNAKSALFNIFDTWQEVSIDVAITSDTSVYSFNLKSYTGKGSTGSITPGGICYIDTFLIRELQDPSTVESTITSGPDLGQVVVSNVTGYASYNSKWFTSLYKFCNGTTGIRYQGYLNNPSFPYVNAISTLNAPECALVLVVCDLSYLGTPSIIKTTNPYSSDGEISVRANSGRGEVRYSLDDWDYSLMTNTTGIFNGLGVGSYTIYARDIANCRATITIEVTSELTNGGQPVDPTPTYGVMYRMQHTDILGIEEERIDILERNFEGDFTEVKGGSSPFVRSLGQTSINNKFDPLRPTYSTITLISDTDLKYIGLFSQDDRKYLVNYYKPLGTLKWRGYVSPSVFSEPYTQAPPYITSITCTDNLNQLESLEFLDKDGNKLKGKESIIKIIAIILNKLSLQLSISVACNISEDSQDANAPLEHTYHEMSSFYEENGDPWNCSRVILALITPFGAKIVQENGVWNIVRVEEQTAQYLTRLYNRNGDFVNAFNYNPVVEISDSSLRVNSIFRDHDHTLEVVPAYGKISIVTKLYRRDNLLSNGSFDIDKIIDGIIEGWTLSGDGLYKISKVIRGTVTDFSRVNVVQPTRGELRTIRGREYASFSTNYPRTTTDEDSALEISNLLDQNTVILQSQTFPVERTYSDFFIFSFNYRINFAGSNSRNARSAQVPEWVRIGWSIKLGTLYYNETFGWTDIEWNYIYVKSFEKDEKFEINVRFKGGAEISIDALTVKLKFFGSNYNDFTTAGELTSMSTVDKPSGFMVRGVSYLWWSGFFSGDLILKDSDEPTSLPNIIRPDDYNGSTNQVVWENTRLRYGTNEYKDIDKIYIYDVNFKFLPNGEEGPQEDIIEIVNNNNYKENLFLELEAGDVTELFVNNKKNLYKNIFFDDSGEPTTIWTRTGVGGSNTLQRLLAASLANQYKFPTFKVSGSLIGFSDINFLTTFKQTSVQPSYSLINGGFTTNLVGWITNFSPEVDWVYGSSSARVSLNSGEQSRLLKQTNQILFTAGQRIRITFDITRSNSVGDRADWLEIKMINETGIETIYQNLVVGEFTYDGQTVRSVRFTLTNDCNNIGFRIRQIEGSGTAQYDMNSFEITGQSVVRYFTVNGIDSDSYNNNHSVNLMQLIPIVPSTDLDIDDSGEGNTGTEGGAGSTGNYSGGDYNSDYNNDFYI